MYHLSMMFAFQMFLTILSPVDDCLAEIFTQNAIQLSRNSTVVVYRCQQYYYLGSGDLVRMCTNGTWSGSEPACVVDSVLPKQFLVLLIVGVTVTLFAFCIPLDFYRFRKRKRACREKQERINMMVRIQPFHAKLMGAQGSSEDEEPPPSRSFGLGSILAFFRFVKNRRNRRTAAPLEAPSQSKTKAPGPKEPMKIKEKKPPDVKPEIRNLESNLPGKSGDRSPRSKSNNRCGCIPSPIPRTKSLGSGVGKPEVKVVAPRSATFTDTKCLTADQKKGNFIKGHLTPIENDPSKQNDSLVDEFMDTRGEEPRDKRRPPTRHPAAKPSKHLKLNIDRYNVRSRDIGGSTSPCNPLPSVGSSPSKSPSFTVDMGF